MNEPLFPHRNLILLLLALVVVKTGLLLALGPVHTPDSGGYIGFADIILRDKGSLSTVDLSKFWQPLTAFRIIGYPFVIALTKMITPLNWDWLLVAVQFSLSLVATGFVYRLAVRLSGSVKIALFAATAHGVGQGLVMDQCILTDSLNGSLLFIVASYIGIAVLDKREPSIPAVAGLGVFVLVAFLLREAGNVLQYLYWPLVLYWILMCSSGPARRVALMLVFIAPMFAGVQSYKAWNHMRTGERFVTTTAQVTLFQPTLELETRGVHVMSGDELLSDMGPLGPLNTEHLMSNLSKINDHLGNEHGLNALEISNYGYDHFFNNWRKYPADMVQFTLSNFREKQAFLAFMPAETLNQLITWSGGERLFPSKGRLWRNLIDESRVDQFLAVFVRGLSRALSVLISLAFLVGVPIKIVREALQKGMRVSAYDPKAVLMFLYWLLYFGYSFAYAMVHLEMRYLMPVEPLSMIIGVTLMSSVAAKFNSRLRGLKAVGT